jgi:hypothetical protein
VDLGELRIPYWNPDAKRYSVARAPLGVVKVSPSASVAAPDAPQQVLPGLPPPRLALEGVSEAGNHRDDSPLFWIFGVFASPAAFGFAFAGRGLASRVARAWRARSSSPAAELRQRLAAAQAASAGQDSRDADAATVRALHAATVAHAGVNVRGAAKTTEVVDRLSRAGVTPEAATGIAELLFECEAARFAPEASDLVQAANRWARAQRVIAQLDRRVSR